MELETQSFLLFYLLSRYRFRNWKKDDINRYQKKKKAEIVNYAVSHSPFFKQYYAGKSAADFFSLPTLNKTIMMDNLSRYNTMGLDKEELITFALDVENKRDFSSRFKDINIGMSSGTSGNKGIILTTKQEESYLKAMYSSRLIFPKGEKLNCAFILRVSSPAFDYSRFGNKLTYVSQLQPMESIIRQLERINPNVVSGPPSMLRLLAKEYLKGTLQIKPKSLYSYAEVLYPDVKQFLENTFACPVREVYQGSEGCYAMTCEKGSLHINEDIVFLELFDEDGKQTQDGKPCFRLLVTDLHKRSQPIIRYEINDILTLSKEGCSCGSHFRVIENIQGREDDLFWGIRTDSGEKHFIYPDYISRRIISISDDIEDYQAIQQSYSDIIVRIALRRNQNKGQIKDALQQGIKRIFSAYHCKEPHVRVIFGRPLPNRRSHKLSRIICHLRVNR